MYPALIQTSVSDRKCFDMDVKSIVCNTVMTAHLTVCLGIQAYTNHCTTMPELYNRLTGLKENSKALHMSYILLVYLLAIFFFPTVFPKAVKWDRIGQMGVAHKCLFSNGFNSFIRLIWLQGS
uniref:Uncharacterized protein n=1 Tax=Sphaerodactylus townsendi TaxID=933632 RepID=A0ACB8EHH7_9SAUR